MVDKLPHTEGEWEVDQKPTITKSGSKVVKCTECGEVLQEEVIPTNTFILYIFIGVGTVILVVVIGICIKRSRNGN